MANSFDSNRLEQLIATLDDVRAQAQVIREQITRKLDRGRANDKTVRPARQGRAGAATGRHTP